MFSNSCFFKIGQRGRVKHAGLLVTAMGLTALLAGCGEYVRYDPNSAPSGGGAPLADVSGVTSLDHHLLSDLMTRYVSHAAGGKEYVLFDYDGLAQNGEDLFYLDQYLALVGGVDPSKLSDADQRLAYWINGYNATVIRSVIAGIKGGTLKKQASDREKVTNDATFFSAKKHAFGVRKGGDGEAVGVSLTLDEVEQGVVRGKLDHPGVARSTDATRAIIKTWHQELWGGKKVDARIHAAFNCAALSCPNLMAAAPYVYDPKSLDVQLKQATTAWLDSDAKGAGPNGVSMLFQWYKEDFVAHSGSVAGFIKAHRTGGDTGVKLDNLLPYDWTLNKKGYK